MLAKPFIGMARTRLITLLIVFVGLELAGALGLVLSNRSTSAAPVSAPVPKATAPSVPDVRSSSPVLTVGKKTLFSAQLPAVANQTVTYQIRYPDTTLKFLYAQANAQGYSQVKVKIAAHARVPHGTVGVGIYYLNKKYAFTHFPVAGN